MATLKVPPNFPAPSEDSEQLRKAFQGIGFQNSDFCHSGSLSGTLSLASPILDEVTGMTKMDKNRKKSRGHSSREPTDMQDQEMDIRKIMKDVENFSYSHMTWKERKKIEDRKIVSLCGKAPKNQRLPLSVARPMMKKQKEREQKMLQERLIMGQFGGKLGGSSKRSAVKHKPENKGLKLSEGHFRNGILNVKHLLNSAPSRDRETGTWKGNGGNKKQGNKGAGKKQRSANPF